MFFRENISLTEYLFIKNKKTAEAVFLINSLKINLSCLALHLEGYLRKVMSYLAT